MRKYFLLITFFICWSNSHSQFANITDSIQIVNLKRILPGLKDTAKVNCLNQLCEVYESYTPPEGVKEMIANVFAYATQANNESIRINYKYGEAFSLIHLAWAARADKKDSIAKNYLEKAISLGEQIKNDKIIGWGYFGLTPLKGLKKTFDETINYHKKAIYHLQLAGDDRAAGEASLWLAYLYSQRGDFEHSYDPNLNAVKFLKNEVRKTKGSSYLNYLYQESLNHLSFLYGAAGDHETALSYLQESRQFGLANETGWLFEPEIGESFLYLKNYDSAFVYLKSFSSKSSENLWGKIFLAKAYIATKDLGQAQTLLQEVTHILKTRKTPGGQIYMGNVVREMARINLAKKQYKEALRNAKQAFALLEIIQSDIMENSELLSNVYHLLKKNDSAYFYLKKYTALKDSIFNRQFLMRLYQFKSQAEVEKKEASLALVNKDNRIKDQQLKQQSQLKKFLFFGLIAMIVIAVSVFRTQLLKRKNDKLSNAKINAELRQKVTELEMQALRAQINPHFIFNCLNSINKFIYKNETREASDYLTRFSRLIRMVLLHSQKKLVPLEDELDMLKLYLDMERLRFKNAFDYHITTTNDIENSSVFIPPLLLQPFCENAIWHGLMHKDGPGHLNIELNEDKGILNCIITDDGVGREKAEEFKSKSAEKEKSMGLKITRERLSLLNQGTTGGTFYEIEDMMNERGEIAGTKVQLKIKYKENIEEFA